MHKIIFFTLILQVGFFLTSEDPILEDFPSLPYCNNKNGSGLVLVSTLDGNLSALNSTGSLIWQIDTGPGPLLVSNIHKLELTNSGEWIRIIPSLTGTLYKFDGRTIDPIPITAESLLKSSFRYSDDLVIAGGIEVRTYGIGFRSGKLIYECTSLKCSNGDNRDVDDMLLVERTTHTLRAVEPNTGSERWNFSVGLHNIKLPRVSCIDSHSTLFDWNITAILPEGELRASTVLNNVEHSWQYTFTSPIVRVWRWSGNNLTEINLFAATNIPNFISSSSLPSIYIGMHNKQLYIHESNRMQDILQGKPRNELVVAESTSITKIPWNPIPASSVKTEDDSTALSVLNLSEYVNGYGYYLYTEADLLKRDKCITNRTILGTLYRNRGMEDVVGFYSVFFWWRQFFLIMCTILICHLLFRFWIQHFHKQEVKIIPKPVELQVNTEWQPLERETFSSPYLNDFETIRCIGRGGFGLVFEVKKKIDECSYAIKRITLPNEEKSRDRVMREVKALAKLDHKNIVRYFNSWVEHPPLGWQEDHDQKWLESLSDGQFMTYEGNNSTITTPSHSKYKPAKRSRSICTNMEKPTVYSEDDFSNINGVTDNDDSFIVFKEDSDVQNSQNSQASLHVSFDENCTNVTKTCSISYGSEVTNNSTSMNHAKKKINWKRPSRRHHSWDANAENSAMSKVSATPPVYLYIQMQLCQKESLKEWLRNHQERDYNKVLDIFLQIVDAVEYVHLSGLIHRDLKPSNIFFSMDGQIKVGDFGLVKDMDGAFDSDFIKKGYSTPDRGHTVEVGTQLYMSPEQSESRIYNYKVDIYSLGLIFFELLVPFSTDMERIKTLTDVKKTKYPKGFSNKYPNEHNLLQNMLCQDPDKRLTTIGIKARPPFNKEDTNYNKNWHYHLANVQKT